MRVVEGIEREEDRQIVTTRLISAPRELVFRAWTDPRHLERWFGPYGFTTTTRVFEFRPGGVWEFEMHGPDGTVFPNLIEWVEIVPPELLRYRQQGGRDDDQNAFETTVTFADRDGATELTLRTIFRTKAQRDYVAENYGAVEGAIETLARLTAYVGELEGAGA